MTTFVIENILMDFWGLMRFFSIRSLGRREEGKEGSWYTQRWIDKFVYVVADENLFRTRLFSSSSDVG